MWLYLWYIVCTKQMLVSHPFLSLIDSPLSLTFPIQSKIKFWSGYLWPITESCLFSPPPTLPSGPSSLTGIIATDSKLDSLLLPPSILNTAGRTIPLKSVHQSRSLLCLKLQRLQSHSEWKPVFKMAIEPHAIWSHITCLILFPTCSKLSTCFPQKEYVLYCLWDFAPDSPCPRMFFP